MSNTVLTPEHFRDIDHGSHKYNGDDDSMINTVAIEIMRTTELLDGKDHPGQPRLGYLALAGYQFLQNGTQPYTTLAAINKLPYGYVAPNLLDVPKAFELGRLSLHPDLLQDLPEELVASFDSVFEDPGSLWRRNAGHYLYPKEDTEEVLYLGQATQTGSGTSAASIVNFFQVVNADGFTNFEARSEQIGSGPLKLRTIQQV